VEGKGHVGEVSILKKKGPCFVGDLLGMKHGSPVLVGITRSLLNNQFNGK